VSLVSGVIGPAVVLKPGPGATECQARNIPVAPFPAHSRRRRRRSTRPWAVLWRQQRGCGTSLVHAWAPALAHGAKQHDRRHRQRHRDAGRRV